MLQAIEIARLLAPFALARARPEARKGRFLRLAAKKIRSPDERSVIRDQNCGPLCRSRISLPPTRSALRRTQTRAVARAASVGGSLIRATRAMWLIGEADFRLNGCTKSDTLLDQGWP